MIVLEEAINELRSGKPILIFDSDNREKETDMVIASQFATTGMITKLRTEAGGLLCVTIREKDAEKIGLNLFENAIQKCSDVPQELFYNGDLIYDRSSSFAIPINHRKTFTGINDRDRSLTAMEFAGFIGRLPMLNGSAKKEFATEFRAPGHLWTLIARDGYFRVRKGHTELSTYIVERAGLIPSATIAEMLSPDGTSLSREKAIEYARSHSLIFIDGSDIVKQWNDEDSNGNRSV